MHLDWKRAKILWHDEEKIFRIIGDLNDIYFCMAISKQDAEKKVYELTEKLIFTKKDFKDLAAGYKEKIKDLENEIKAVVEEAGGDLSLKTE